MLEGECQTDTLVKIPLRTMNRHGLIAGATGSGKTKTLQILAEQLSSEGVPVLLMDIKGDLSGIAAPSPGHPKIDERHEKIGIPFEASTSPIEFLTLSDEPGARLRATVTEFGPVLFSKILQLSDTQSGIVSVVFKYCDDNNIPLVDLKDFKKSEVSFEVEDLLRTDEDGKGMVSVVRLTDLQDRPKLFSTFMLQMMAEIYATFPEQGDAEKPKLIIFIDEAHLMFDEASDALLDQIEAIVKLIRSKGVGLFFVTQNPADVPDAVPACLHC